MRINKLLFKCGASVTVPDEQDYKFTGDLEQIIRLKAIVPQIIHNNYFKDFLIDQFNCRIIPWSSPDERIDNVNRFTVIWSIRWGGYELLKLTEKTKGYSRDEFVPLGMTDKLLKNCPNPKLKMTEKAEGHSYNDFIAVGWSDEQLINAGLAVYDEETKPVVYPKPDEFNLMHDGKPAFKIIKDSEEWDEDYECVHSHDQASISLGLLKSYCKSLLEAHLNSLPTKQVELKDFEIEAVEEFLGRKL